MRSFLLDGVDLSSIPDTEEEFRVWLDLRTQDAVRNVARKARGKCWGVARKSINLYLRACVYNHYLRENYPCLCRIVQWLEVPLDSRVGKKLHDLYPSRSRPWTSIKGLTAKTSAQFQQCAKQYAETMGYPARVFVDHEFYLPSYMDDSPPVRQ